MDRGMTHQLAVVRLVAAHLRVHKWEENVFTEQQAVQYYGFKLCSNLFSDLFLIQRIFVAASDLGWEFAHRFSERIGRFLRKIERPERFAQKTSDSLIRSFLVSDLSKSLMVAHFW